MVNVQGCSRGRPAIPAIGCRLPVNTEVVHPVGVCGMHPYLAEPPAVAGIIGIGLAGHWRPTFSQILAFVGVLEI